MSQKSSSGRMRLAWIAAVFIACLGTVLCFIVATAWFLGGRTAPVAPTVQSVLPPEPRTDPSMATEDEDLATVSALHPAAGTEDEYVIGENSAILPGARESAQVKEIPIDKLSELKSLGWASPYLSGFDMQPEYAETGSVEGVRTIQVHMTDGDNFINVSETRAEEEGLDLVPLSEKLLHVVNLDDVTWEKLLLTTGHESTLLIGGGSSNAWTSTVETGSVQYVITSDLPPAAASEVSSWVMVTDRSRVKVLPTSPGATDRLERGFEEIISWLP